jgi:putative two-component system response regulator
MAGRIAQAIGLPPEEAALLRRAAALHDIGKIGIPDALLHKPGALTESEMRVMQTHAAIGARILGGSHVPLLRVAEKVARSHHERWDGSGYPNGLKGDDIPLAGRIVAVADAFDAMTNDRPYRKALPVSEVLAYLKKERDGAFERRLVDALVRLAEFAPAARTHRRPGGALQSARVPGRYERRESTPVRATAAGPIWIETERH